MVEVYKHCQQKYQVGFLPLRLVKSVSYQCRKDEVKEIVNDLLHICHCSTGKVRLAPKEIQDVTGDILNPLFVLLIGILEAFFGNSVFYSLKSVCLAKDSGHLVALSIMSAGHVTALCCSGNHCVVHWYILLFSLQAVSFDHF